MTFLHAVQADITTLAVDAIEAAWNAVDRCEVLIAVGASLEVEPAASLPWRALARGARVV